MQRDSLYARGPVQYLLLFVAIGLVMPPTVHASRRTTMYRMDPRQYRVEKGVTAELIRDAIVLSLERAGWRPLVQAADAVEAEMVVQGGKHTASVEVKFDDAVFVINYVGSFNLGYKCRQANTAASSAHPAARVGSRVKHSQRGRCEELIHPHYNAWVRRVEDDIARRLAQLRPGQSLRPTVAPARGPSPLFVADELLKLKALRDAGALTEEEFELQKRWLLGAP